MAEASGADADRFWMGSSNRGWDEQRLEDLEASARATLRPDEICAGQFIAGPIPLVDLARVMRLAGAAGQV